MKFQAIYVDFNARVYKRKHIIAKPKHDHLKI